jgi:hypothetical protein
VTRQCSAEANRAGCNCTWEPCPRKGVCCECIAYHRSMGEAPACLFPAEAERTFDRSLRRLAATVKR